MSLGMGGGTAHTQHHTPSDAPVTLALWRPTAKHCFVAKKGWDQNEVLLAAPLAQWTAIRLKEQHYLSPGVSLIIARPSFEK